MTNLKISIITKDQVAYQGEAKSVTVPTQMGIIGVLPGHMQLVSALGSGDLIFQIENNKERKFKISGGVLEVRPHSEVIILADRIEE